MQSQEFFGSDSQMHSLIMDHLDLDRFEVYVACNRGATGTTPALEALSRLDDLKIRPTRFGPTVNSQRRIDVARQAAFSGPAAVLDLARLVAYARRHSIDVIHGTEKPRDAFYGYLLAKASGAKSATHLHVKAANWISRLTRWAMKRNDALIGVSDFICDSFADMGYERAKLHTVLNALDTSRIPPSTVPLADLRAEVRSEFGIGDGVPILLIASRLFPWKGHSELLDALAEVKADGRDFHLLVVGEDDPRATPGGGSYIAELRTRATSLDLDDRVTFTGYRTDVARLMEACDLYTMPSFEEPCAVVYLEAMAHRKAIVALDNGGTRELVVHDETGLLSEPWDVHALAKNITRLIDDEEERVAMGERGRTRLDAKFTPDRMARDVEAVYDKLVG